MTGMTAFRVIAVRSVEVMAFIANGLNVLIVFMLVVVSMNPTGTDGRFFST
jgi:hypothetical protein